MGDDLLNKYVFYKAFLVPVVFFLIIATFALFRNSNTFSFMSDSFSMLGGQSLDDKWIMNTAWMGFGILTIIVVSGYHQKESLPIYMTYPMLSFGFSVFFLGIFSGDSGLANDTINLEEVSDHFVFYGIALGSIILSIFFHVFMTKDMKSKVTHLIYLLVIILSTLLYLLMPEGKGFIEKFGWLVMMIWLTCMYGRVINRGNLTRF
jgi:hypothetical membrane protein